MFKSVWFRLVLILNALAGPAIGQDQAPAKELVQFIRDAKKAGVSDLDIERNAVNTGWNPAAVKEAVAYLRGAAGAAKQEPEKKPEPDKKQDSPKTPAEPNQTAAATPAPEPGAQPASRRDARCRRRGWRQGGPAAGTAECAR